MNDEGQTAPVDPGVDQDWSLTTPFILDPHIPNRGYEIEYYKFFIDQFLKQIIYIIYLLF